MVKRYYCIMELLAILYIFFSLLWQKRSFEDCLILTMIFALGITFPMLIYIINISEFHTFRNDMINAGQFDTLLIRIDKKLRSLFLTKKQKFTLLSWKIDVLCRMNHYEEALAIIKNTDKKYIDCIWRVFYLYYNLLCELRLNNTNEAKRLYELIMQLPSSELFIYQSSLEKMKSQLYPESNS